MQLPGNIGFAGTRAAGNRNDKWLFSLINHLSIMAKQGTFSHHLFRQTVAPNRQSVALPWY